MSNYALRLPESLKQAAKRITAEDDATMNQFFVVAIAEKISATETADFFSKPAALASGAASADAAWNKVGTQAALPRIGVSPQYHALEQASSPVQTLDFLPAWQTHHETAPSRRVISGGRNVPAAGLPRSESESPPQPVTN